MSRKEYIKFAAVFNELLKSDTMKYCNPQQVFDAIVKHIAYIFQDDNNRFDRRRFMDAVYKERS